MNVEDSIWDKLTRVVICLLLIAGLVGIGVWYMPLIHQNERYRTTVLGLDAEIQQEVETKKQLEAAIKSLNSDPNAVARLARMKLGYARPDETVIRFESPATNGFIFH